MRKIKTSIVIYISIIMMFITYCASYIVICADEFDYPTVDGCTSNLHILWTNSSGNNFDYYITLNGGGDRNAVAYYVGTSIYFMDMNKTPLTYYYNGEMERPDGYVATYNNKVSNVAFIASSTSNVLYTNIKIFDSLESANNYIDYGDLTGLVQDVSPTYNAENLQFESIKLNVYDSNEFDSYYLEFVYSAPQEMIGAKVTLDYTYNIAIKSLVNANNYGDNATSKGEFYITDTRGSYVVYIKDIGAVNSVIDTSLGAQFQGQTITKRTILGGASYTALELIYETEKSDLNIVANVCTDNNVYGGQYIFDVDLASGKGSMFTQTPDSDGNYTYNNDYKSNGGNYYVEVGNDSWGNTTYTYYYNDYSKNSTTIITNPNEPSEDTTEEDGEGSDSNTTIENGGSTITNTNTNNPTFENNVNVTVEGDKINNEVDNEIQDTIGDTDGKGFIGSFLGLFDIMENNSFMKVFGSIFGFFPSEFVTIITTAITLGIGILIYKGLRR